MAAGSLALASCGLRAEEFFPVRDENPLLRGFYRPLASDSRADAGEVLAAAFSIMNTLESERRGPRQGLLVDGESDTLRLSFEDSATDAWRYRVGLPLTRDSGGFLDSTINAWHQLFGLPRGSRPFYPKNELVYFYQGGNRIYRHTPASGIGDLSIDTGWYAVDAPQRTVSLWTGLKAPTGSVADLTSDGAWDAAAWAHLAERWTRWQLGAEAGVVEPFGDALFGGAAHRASAFARLAVTRELGSIWSVRAQLDGQTRRVGDTELRFLGPSAQLSVGIVRRLAHGFRLEFGFSEDIAVNTAPDITFFLGIHD